MDRYAECLLKQDSLASRSRVTGYTTLGSSLCAAFVRVAHLDFR